MGRLRLPGLVKRGKLWHIDKSIRGYGRLCESTGCCELEAAERYLTSRVHAIRQLISGIRPGIVWREAATKYLNENLHKASISKDAYHLRMLDEHIGDLLIDNVHDATLGPFIKMRRSQKVRTKTINNALGVVRRILNLAAQYWRLENGATWLESAPKISMQKPFSGRPDSLKTYPLDWDEQDALLSHLPEHLSKMTIFKLNTGCRESEVTGLRWRWEWQTDLSQFKGRIFLIPGDAVLPNDTGIKNRDDRLIVLNDLAKAVVDSCRGDHEDFVFVRGGKPVLRMNNTSWKRAWQQAGLPTDKSYRKGVHNLRHTCGGRLRAAGVPLETRSIILGHRVHHITTHYSLPEIREILSAVNLLSAAYAQRNNSLTLIKINQWQQAA
ncbi:MAG: tyrosine-type recombinase/integrase [Pseudomonadales bacterium]|nr:tyrosine-type recombinase/integrase [Pseudomonadales bacterium]